MTNLFKLESEIGNRPPNFIYRYPECVLEYIEHLAPSNSVGKIWKDTHKVSFADYWSSVDFPHLLLSIIIITNKLDRLQKTKKYQWKISYWENH